jgi:uncharacterized protein YecT (DUF1311 family)
MKVLILLAASLTSLAAYAIDCTKANTQAEMTLCSNADYANADAKLDASYNKLRAKLGDVAKRQLRDAQVSWIKYRDADCVFQSSGVEGGSAHGMVFAACLTAKTQARTAELNALLQCEEGDLSCPH